MIFQKIGLVPVGNSELTVPHGPREVRICERKDGLHVAGVKPVWPLLQHPPAGQKKGRKVIEPLSPGIRSPDLDS